MELPPRPDGRSNLAPVQVQSQTQGWPDTRPFTSGLKLLMELGRKALLSGLVESFWAPRVRVPIQFRWVFFLATYVAQELRRNVSNGIRFQLSSLPQ